MFFRDIQPSSDRYTGLQNSLSMYRNIAMFGSWDSIVLKNDKVKIEFGDTSGILNKIAERLMITHELDSIYTDSVFTVYDSILFKAVVRFQQNQGLLSDGIIGKHTINNMNIPVKDRIKQICVNLERFRWFNYPDTGRYIMINIPDYCLYAIDNNTELLKMKICVGNKREKNYNEKLKRYLKTKDRKLKPDNHETPCMFGKISYFVLNPKWLVPKSIGEKEIIYKLVEDSMYLKNQNMRVLLNGQELDTDSIDWRIYLDSKLPFRFIQEPGTMNALGKVKFIFKNKFDIYLHDTPNKTKFINSYRAVSHGCIRIQKPLELISFLIKHEKNIELDDIRIMLGMRPVDKSDKNIFKEKIKKYEEYKKEAEETGNSILFPAKKIFLKEFVNIYIDYFTAWTDSNGTTHFRNDVYGKDKTISERLF